MNKCYERNGFITLSTDSYTLVFDKNSDSVHYDAKKGCLVISNLPPELVEKLEQAIKGRQEK